MTKDKDKKRSLPRPTPVDPRADEREARLAREANTAFDAENAMLPAFTGPASELPGVPLDEALDPAKIEEYCQREPWILTPAERAPFSAKFGFIPERFQYHAEKLEREGRSELAQQFNAAAKKGYEIYFAQLKKDFRILESRMDRQQIGVYAQQLWVNVTRQVEEEGADVGRFVGRERLGQMDDGLRECAREAIFKNTKWLALNINEIPVRGTGMRPRPLN